MKKYIIWGYYGQEGWSPLFTTDSKQELLENYQEYLNKADKVVVTQNIPILLGIEND